MEKKQVVLTLAEKKVLLSNVISKLNTLLKMDKSPDNDINLEVKAAFELIKLERDELCELSYDMLRDKYIQLIITCFMFEPSEIKSYAYDFTRRLFDNKFLEGGLVIALLTGGYLSPQTLLLLKEFHKQMKSQCLDTLVYASLKSILRTGTYNIWSEKEKLYINQSLSKEQNESLKEILDIYNK